MRFSTCSRVIQGSFQAGRLSRIQPAGNPHTFALPSPLTLRLGGGQRLPEAVQRKMEDFFGARLDDVRVHAGGSEAASIGALAFTSGSAIYFAPGQYNPSTPYGQRLLGHELTHVLQQRAGRVRSPLGGGLAVVQDPLLEAEAERKGALAALHREPVSMSSRPVQAKPAGGGTLPVRLPVPPPVPPRTAAQLKPALLAKPPARPVVTPPVIQRVITQSAAFRNNPKVQKAFRPFQTRLRGDKELQVLCTDPNLDVQLDIGNDPKARAATKIGGIYSGAYVKLPQYEGKRAGLVKATGGLGFDQIEISIQVMDHFIRDSTPPLIAKTLAHEVGAHVAPYLGSLANMLAGRKLSKKQRRLIASDASGGGRHDHIQIRNRSQLHYERLIRGLAKDYGTGTKSARELVNGYLDDISRYDERGDPLDGQWFWNRYRWFGRTVEGDRKLKNWQDASWTKSYLDKPSLPWTRPQRIAGLTAGLGAAYLTGALNVAASSAFDLATWGFSEGSLALG